MRGTWLNPHDANTKLKVVAERWRETLSLTRRAKTVERHQGFLRKYVVPRFGECRVGAITFSEVEALNLDLLHLGLSAQSAKHALRALVSGTT